MVHEPFRYLINIICFFLYILIIHIYIYICIYIYNKIHIRYVVVFICVPNFSSFRSLKTASLWSSFLRGTQGVRRRWIQWRSPGRLSISVLGGSLAFHYGAMMDYIYNIYSYYVYIYNCIMHICIFIYVYIHICR